MLANVPQFKAEPKYQTTNKIYLTEDQKVQLENIRKNKKKCQDETDKLKLISQMRKTSLKVKRENQS